jgi:hypothetical protein
MLNRSINILLITIMLSLWTIALRPLFEVLSIKAQAHPAQNRKDNEELKRLCAEDQSDRTPPAGKSIDIAALGPRDKARLKRVKEIYMQNLLQTADDYDCAATVLQHGEVPEDFLLAHEFWVVAISKGKNDQDTLTMAAASEDRYLTNIGRPQRFGTQIHSVDNGPIELYPIDSSVPDGLRRVMTGHSLSEVKARAIEMNKK